MNQCDTPVTLVTGFLECGKTTVIKEILRKGYGDFSGITILIDCEEEAIEEYDPAVLAARNVVLIRLEGPFALTEEYLAELEDKWEPSQVIIEYNGMAKVSYLNGLKLPEGWEIARQMTVYDAGVFRLYMDRLRDSVRDQIKNTDIVMFNRVENVSGKGDAGDRKAWTDFIHMVNRDAEVFFEPALS